MTTIGVVFVRHGTRIKLISILPAYRQTVDKGSMHQRCLAILVEQSMGLSPFERAVFVFCNRRRTRMKLLFFERSGFVLVLKALSEDRFRWPRREAPVVTLDTEQLRWLLDGIDLDAMVRHPVRQYEFVG
ncbi:IS66 family insertion sequence element accessory protein TnpB [Rhizobium ruizarguesonis]|uniref:IS66 family insertion sequence element accessory protein TnpB n=1 Tax=Rhizobium ruizarguesonis TaxID=2081791 RepID=UPI0037190443